LITGDHRPEIGDQRRHIGKPYPPDNPDECRAEVPQGFLNAEKPGGEDEKKEADGGRLQHTRRRLVCENADKPKPEQVDPWPVDTRSAGSKEKHHYRE
jgi:hypothetical protein